MKPAMQQALAASQQQAMQHARQQAMAEAREQTMAEAMQQDCVDHNQHLMDTCFRFAGADGATCELECSSQRLCEASPLLRQALDPEEGFLAAAERDARGRLVLAMANPRFGVEAVADAVRLIHHTFCFCGSLKSEDVLRQLRALPVLDWLQVLDTYQPVRAFTREVMAQIPAAATATAAGPGGFVAAHLAELPRAALAATPASALSRLSAQLSAAERDTTTALDDLCVMLRVFDTAACGQQVARRTVQFGHRAVLDWLAATTQPAGDAASLALLRCPPVLVARWLVARRQLTSELFASVVSANMHRVTLPDLAALACFTPLAAQAHPDLVRLAMQRQDTAVQLRDSGGRRVISIKMHSDTAVSRATVRVESLVSVSAVGDDITVKFRRDAPVGGYELFALADKSSAVFTTVLVRCGDNNGTGSRVQLHNTQAANALGTGNRYVLLVPTSCYWAPSVHV